MWFLPTLQRLFLPLVALAVALGWLSTSAHEIPLGSVGVRSHLGRFDDAALEPGLHWTLPFPLDEVRVVDRDGLRRLVLGFDADTGEPILWDRQHYVGEENQLVGQGEELLTISVPIFYRIADPVRFYRHLRDPEAVVRDLARRQLLLLTTERSAFGIMTTDRDALSDEFHRALQRGLDELDSGLEIALVCLRDIHPPVDVAPSYQEVVSAIEEREASVHEGESYREENLPNARTAAALARLSAETVLHRRTAEATAQAASFEFLRASYAAAPDVFRTRLAYATFDESLHGVRKLILDADYRDTLASTVDLRRTLNPDFAPDVPPAPASLVPTFNAPLNDFERSIEGYLQMGKGAVPATRAAPPDPDNPLQSTP